MYCVYIIQSLQDGRFYTGLTESLRRRLEEHDIGRSSTPSTKTRGPFRLIYFETFYSRTEARQREKFWKSGVGRKLRSRITEMPKNIPA